MDAKARIALLVAAQGAKKAADDLENVAKQTGAIGDKSERSGKRMGIAQRAADGFKNTLKGLAHWAKLGAAALIGITAVMAKQSIDAAVNLGEQINKTKVVFRGSERRILSWSKTTAEALGISRREALEAAGVFGNMLVPMGIGRKHAGKMSKSLVELAADMASFNNASPAETLDALRAGLAGETEPLRRYGVFLNQARIEQEAARLGLTKHGKELSAAAKAQASYSLFLKDTKDAQGDFARTSDSLANQQRILNAQWEDAKARLGKALLPLATKAAKALSQFFEGMEDGTGAGGRFVKVVSGAFKTVKSAVVDAVSTVDRWLHRNRDTIRDTGVVISTLAKVVKWTFLNVVLPIVRRFAKGFFGILGGVIRIARGFVRFFSGVFSGDFRKAWQGIKDIFSGSLKTLIGFFRAFTAPLGLVATAFWNAIKWPFDHIIKPVFDFLKGKVEWIIDKIEWALDKAKELGGVVEDFLPFGGDSPGFDFAVPGDVSTSPSDSPDAQPAAASPGATDRRSPVAAPARASSAGSRVIELHSHVYLDGREAATSVRKVALRDLLKESTA